MIRLINSALTPQKGLVYAYDDLTEAEYVEIIKEARGAGGQVKSYIGYHQNVEYLEEVHGIRVELNRAPTPAEPGDILLIMKVDYRPDANTKGQPIENLRERLEFGITRVFSKDALRNTP